MMSAFSCKKKAFLFVQKSTFTQSNSVRAFVRGFLALLSFFVRKKVNITENITSADSVSRIRPRECSEFAKHTENKNDVTIFRHDVIVNFFWRCFGCLFKFSYWSKFHVNIITGSGIMTIFFYKELTRNPEIRNTPVWVLSNIWRLGQVMDTMSLIECYRMLENSRVTVYRFWIIEGKPTLCVCVCVCGCVCLCVCVGGGVGEVEGGCGG